MTTRVIELLDEMESEADGLVSLAETFDADDERGGRLMGAALVIQHAVAELRAGEDEA